MEKYIIELLENNVRVVLPDLGAFIVKQRKPLKIIFNEFLKYNDGLLIEYTAKSDNSNKEEATKKVSDFVSSVKDKIAKNEEVALKSLGVLIKDQSGNITFSLESGAKVKESSALADDKKTTKTSQTKEEKESTKKKTEEKAVSKTETKATPKAEEKKQAASVPPKPTPPTSPPKQEKPAAPPPPAAAPQSSQPVYKSKYTRQPDDGEKKSTWLWLAAAVLAIIIVALTLFISKSSSDKKEKEVAVQQESQQVQEEAPELIEENQNDEEIAEPIEEPIQDVEPYVSQTGKRYHIIAGCFKVPRNAENYADFLRKKGYPAENLGVINGYHVVSFNSFPTKSEALRELEIIRSEYEAEAWLKKY